MLSKYGNEIYEFKEHEQTKLETMLTNLRKQAGNDFKWRLHYVIKGERLDVRIIEETESVEVVEKWPNYEG
uniref:Uncharacterized protein n=1 Tax=viral metagenome TaxID=1070528 RepID=A0A6H1ZA01_9ZZZZ